MNTGKLKNMKFEVSHFWGEKRPTNNSEDRIPTMLGPAMISPDPKKFDTNICEMREHHSVHRGVTSHFKVP